MSYTLEENIHQYKLSTLKLIEELEKDNDEVQYLLDRRQELIDNMISIEYSKEEISSLIEKYEILILEDKLKMILQSKREEVRKDINQLNRTRNANTSYSKKYIQNTNYFNKKI